MPVKVRCSKCEKVVNAPDAARGKAIRCPGCKQPIRVPAASGKKEKEKEPKPKEQSPEDLLGRLDLSKVADDEVQFCVNCHAELPFIDEDDEEAANKPVICQKCGVDQETGLLSKKAQRIKQLKGIDPDLFHKHLRSNSYKFVQDNVMLAIRTSIYMLVTSNIGMFCFFMTLWCSNTPPKVFWSILTFITLMVTPGWTWFLTTSVVNATLSRQDIIKKLNFDFFLCSALGIKFLFWQFAFLSPFWLAAGGMYYFAELDLPICAIPVLTGYFLVLPVVPVVMSHMSMPITIPGWQPHIMLPIFFRNAKACFHWAWWAGLTAIPVLAMWGAILFFFFDDLEAMFRQVHANSEITWAKATSEALGSTKQPLTDAEKEALAYANSIKDNQQTEVNYNVTFIPNGIWLLSSMYYGFFMLFLMRGIGLFTTVFKRELDLVSERKEIKFVSSAEKKKRREELRRQKLEAKRKAKEEVFDEDELEDEDEEDEDEE